MKIWLSELLTSFRAIIGLAVIVCGIYPASVWLLNRALFPAKSGGSLIQRDGRVVGSWLIAQAFVEPRYFHPRPSAAGSGYDASRSGGTNLGPTSKTLVKTVGRRAAQYREENELPQDALVPADAVTSSGSGLDPHISPENARLQAGRVARARGVPEEKILEQVKAYTEGRTLGIIGQPRVNIMKLNLALDGVHDVGR
ncbi:MAG: K(+)-transporting ATPase subunit C [Candidatus Aminicenantes bacterium]|nr:K(+)-transporting ATPase subunit C [Candidatus Aminicenantes bacterium]